MFRKRSTISVVIPCILVLLFGVLANGWCAKTEIRFMTSETDPPSVKAFKEIIKGFEASHPDIKIKLELVGADDLFMKIAAGIVAQSPPDISQIDAEQVVTFEKEGHLFPLDDMIDAIGRDDFVQGSIIQSGGHDWSMPYCAGGTVMWIRKDLFDKHGVKPPTNWEEMIAAAKSLNMDTNGDGKIDMYGVAVPAGQNKWTGHILNAFMWQNGQTMFDKDLNVTFNTPKTVEALKYYKELTKYSPPDIGNYSYYETINAFTSGRVAMAPYMGRLISQVAANNPGILKYTKAIPMPTNKVVTSYGSWNQYVVFKGSKHPKEAKEFLKWLTTGEEGIKFLLTVPGHLIPPLQSQLESPALWNDSFMKQHRAEIDVVFKAGERALTPLTEPGAIVDDRWTGESYYNPFATYVFTKNIRSLTVQKVYMAGESPEKAAAWAQKELEKIVEENRSLLQK